MLFVGSSTVASALCLATQIAISSSSCSLFPSFFVHAYFKYFETSTALELCLLNTVPCLGLALHVTHHRMQISVQRSIMIVIQT